MGKFLNAPAWVKAKMQGRQFARSVRRRLSVVAAVVALSLAGGASAQVTLPATGVDLEDYIPLMVTALGGIVGAVVAAWIAFRVIAIGLRKLNKVGG